MRVSPIQESFAAGQISGRAIGAVSSDAYQQGVILARNMFPLSQGPMRSRCGFRFSDTIHEDNSRSVLFPFFRSVGSDLVVEVGDSKIVVRDTSGVIVESLSENLLPDPEFRNAGVYGPWRNTRDALDATALPPSIRLYATDPSFFPTRGHNGLTAEQRIWPYFTPPAGVAGETAVIRARPTASGNGLFWDPNRKNFLHSCLRDLVTTPQPATVHSYVGTVRFGFSTLYPSTPPANLFATVIITADEAGTTIIHREEFQFSNFDQEHTFNFTFTPAVSEFWVTIGNFYSDETNDFPHTRLEWLPQFVGYDIAGASDDPVEFTSPYNASQLDAIQFAIDSAERELWLFHPDVEPRRIKEVGGLWTFTALSAVAGYVAPPLSGPVFNATDGWPRAGCFHDARLYLAGTHKYPAAVWGSRTFVYQDFDSASPSSKDDPVTFPITYPGIINWIVPMNGRIVVGFDTGEGVLWAPAAGVLAFDDFKFDEKTAYGSGTQQAMRVGRKIIYTIPSRNRLRTFENIGDNENLYDGSEVSYNSTDILLNQVKAIRYANNPEMQILCLLEDGTIAGCTFDYNSKLPGWHQIVTDGVIESIAVNRQRTSDFLWAVVNREGQRFVEYMTWCQFSIGSSLDSFYQGPANEDGEIVSPSLSHLIGKTVSPVVRVLIPDDDPRFGPIRFSVHPPVVVTDSAGDGMVELEEWTAGQTVYIGIPYDITMRTLPIEGVSQAGTALVSRQRWAKIFVRLSRSSIPLINGTAPPERKGQGIMDTAPPFVTADVSVGGDDWIEDALVDGSLDITQDLPLFVEVSAIFGKLAVKEI